MRRRVPAVLISVEVIVVVVLLLLVLNVLTGGALGPSEEELMLADPRVLVTQV